MKKFAFAVVLGATLCSYGIAADSWTGVISDAKCGAGHKDADTNAKSAKCVQACVKGGQAPVLVSEGKVYKIADASKVTDHLGHKVVVTGELNGDTIQVDSVKMDH